MIKFGDLLDECREAAKQSEGTKPYSVSWRNLDEPHGEFHFLDVNAHSELHAETKAMEELKRDGIPEKFIEIKAVELKEVESKSKKVTEQDYEEEDKDTPPEPPEEVKEPDAQTLEARKEYLGKTEDTHYYFLTTEGAEGEIEDLVIADQEGVKRYSALDHNIEVGEEKVPDFIIAAIQDIDVQQIERGIFMKYILPRLLEEDESDEEMVEEPEEEEEKPKKERPKKKKPLVPEEPEEEEELPRESKKVDERVSRSYTIELNSYDIEVLKSGEPSDKLTNLAKEIYLQIESELPEEEELPRESKTNESKNLIEMKVTDPEGNEFDIRLADDGTVDTVIDINGEQFRFSPEFASMWVDPHGGISEEGLRELALDALASMEQDEYNELMTKERDVGVEGGEVAGGEVEGDVGEKKKPPTCEKCGKAHWPFQKCSARESISINEDTQQMIDTIIKAYQKVGVGTTPTSGDDIIQDMIESYWGERSVYEVRKDGIYSFDAGELSSWEEEKEFIVGECSEEKIKELYDLALDRLGVGGSKKSGRLYSFPYDIERQDKEQATKEGIDQSDITKLGDDELVAKYEECQVAMKDKYISHFAIMAAEILREIEKRGLDIEESKKKIKEKGDNEMDKNKVDEKKVSETDVAKGAKALIQLAKEALKDGNYQKAAEYCSKLAEIEAVVPSEAEAEVKSEEKDEEKPAVEEAPDETLEATKEGDDVKKVTEEDKSLGKLSTPKGGEDAEAVARKSDSHHKKQRGAANIKPGQLKPVKVENESLEEKETPTSLKAQSDAFRKKADDLDKRVDKLQKEIAKQKKEGKSPKQGDKEAAQLKKLREEEDNQDSAEAAEDYAVGLLTKTSKNYAEIQTILQRSYGFDAPQSEEIVKRALSRVGESKKVTEKKTPEALLKAAKWNEDKAKELRREAGELEKAQKAKDKEAKDKAKKAAAKKESKIQVESQMDITERKSQDRLRFLLDMNKEGSYIS